MLLEKLKEIVFNRIWKIVFNNNCPKISLFNKRCPKIVPKINFLIKNSFANKVI